ncbi:hypothetical protein [Kerstersia gyiorum]|jgi:hypothetical protein|uniref:hypothetical protein n=1 Tax=Kerstersia gyiorum TaxID=206506 RepID=UPI00242EB9B0|nr:hypothetical protein [Kerstersia gyiorum]MCH4272814.1 hypothetical protein [Kerstersia gyiorum]MCI1230442.1 hypothetical protein [Kerstersia gyiorum]
MMPRNAGASHGGADKVGHGEATMVHVKRYDEADIRPLGEYSPGTPAQGRETLRAGMAPAALRQCLQAVPGHVSLHRI